jgi:hypothetical protein
MENNAVFIIVPDMMEVDLKVLRTPYNCRMPTMDCKIDTNNKHITKTKPVFIVSSR